MVLVCMNLVHMDGKQVPRALSDSMADSIQTLLPHAPLLHTKQADVSPFAISRPYIAWNRTHELIINSAAATVVSPLLVLTSPSGPVAFDSMPTTIDEAIHLQIHPLLLPLGTILHLTLDAYTPIPLVLLPSAVCDELSSLPDDVIHDVALLSMLLSSSSSAKAPDWIHQVLDPLVAFLAPDCRTRAWLLDLIMSTTTSTTTATSDSLAAFRHSFSSRHLAPIQAAASLPMAILVSLFARDIHVSVARLFPSFLLLLPYVLPPLIYFYSKEAFVKAQVVLMLALRGVNVFAQSPILIPASCSHHTSTSHHVSELVSLALIQIWIALALQITPFRLHALMRWSEVIYECIILIMTPSCQARWGGGWDVALVLVVSTQLGLSLSQRREERARRRHALESQERRKKEMMSSGGGGGGKGVEGEGASSSSLFQ